MTAGAPPHYRTRTAGTACARPNLLSMQQGFQRVILDGWHQRNAVRQGLGLGGGRRSVPAAWGVMAAFLVGAIPLAVVLLAAVLVGVLVYGVARIGVELAGLVGIGPAARAPAPGDAAVDDGRRNVRVVQR